MQAKVFWSQCPKLSFSKKKKKTIKTYPVFVQSNCGRVNCSHMTCTLIVIPINYRGFFSANVKTDDRISGASLLHSLPWRVIFTKPSV